MSLCGICRDKPRLWKLGRLGVTGLATARSSFDTFMGSRNAGEGESVGLGASERDRVLDGEREIPSTPLCRARAAGVGVWSRLFCSSARVNDEAALEGGAGRSVVDIVLKGLRVQENAETRWSHYGEVAAGRFTDGVFTLYFKVVRYQELHQAYSSHSFSRQAPLLTPKRLAPASCGYIRMPHTDRLQAHSR
jgi:hypothetical protein